MNFKRLEEITRANKGLFQTGKSFHTTFVFHGNKMICMANNDYTRLHPYHKWTEYKAHKESTKNYTAGIHSEIKALIKMGLDDCSHLSIVNVRIDNNDNPAISKPCKNCERILRGIKFRKITYYDGEKYITERY